MKVLFLSIMKSTSSITFALVALVLLVYTYFCVDQHHYFLINAAWNSNLIEAKMIAYLVAGLGFCFSIFYAVFYKVLNSPTLVIAHILLYFLLVINVILWDNNIFSLQEVVDSQGYNTIGEIKSEYSNVIDKDHAYRVLFWVFLVAQTIGLLNLVLGFFKSNKD